MHVLECGKVPKDVERTSEKTLAFRGFDILRETLKISSQKENNRILYDGSLL